MDGEVADSDGRGSRRLGWPGRVRGADPRARRARPPDRESESSSRASRRPRVPQPSASPGGVGGRTGGAESRRRRIPSRPSAPTGDPAGPPPFRRWRHHGAGTGDGAGTLPRHSSAIGQRAWRSRIRVGPVRLHHSHGRRGPDSESPPCVPAGRRRGVLGAESAGPKSRDPVRARPAGRARWADSMRRRWRRRLQGPGPHRISSKRFTPRAESESRGPHSPPPPWAGRAGLMAASARSASSRRSGVRSVRRTGRLRSVTIPASERPDLQVRPRLGRSRGPAHTVVRTESMRAPCAGRDGAAGRPAGLGWMAALAAGRRRPCTMAVRLGRRHPESPGFRVGLSAARHTRRLGRTEIRAERVCAALRWSDSGCVRYDFRAGSSTDGQRPPARA